MKQKLNYLLVVLSIAFVTKSYSQKGNYHITNGISVNGAITKFDIITDNFETEQVTGFLGGFLATVDIPNRWYNMSFGMQLSENHINILGRPTLISTEDAFIEYKLFTAQVALLGHIKIIQRYFTIDVGPMLQYNGKLELKNKSQEAYYINNYNNLSAADITDISKFNINGAIGASAGLDFISLKVQYIYGFTNILKKLNSENLDTSGNSEKSFKGNQSMLVLGAVISF
ncbi:hypothetical protein V8G69_02395 [Gaetbulibacter sp. M235]|uniref:hypothetical protein n=1 Tax=Gaetbulibacter sp. M235 TaxID=3126510 RepID=UPI00374F3BCD